MGESHARLETDTHTHSFSENTAWVNTIGPVKVNAAMPAPAAALFRSTASPVMTALSKDARNNPPPLLLAWLAS